MKRRRLSVDDYVAGVRDGDRAVLGRAVTLIESNRPAHRRQARELLNRLLPDTGGARRVGITGVPGVGKSTFIESLGMHLLEQGRRVAVLAVDPTSSLRGGSILGDKTRMARLSADRRAFIRPSPSRGSLGGVHRKTRETLLLCEAAGFDVVLVETVGVGQSETRVADMVDTFLVLMLTGAGDELQGIKRGILELADVLAINKADGPNRERADRARLELERALHYMRPRSEHWTPPVLTCSGLDGVGVPEVWARVEAHAAALGAAGELESRRRRQGLDWMRSLLEEGLFEAFLGDPQIATRLPELEAEVMAGRLAPGPAAEDLLERFLARPHTRDEGGGG